MNRMTKSALGLALSLFLTLAGTSPAPAPQPPQVPEPPRAKLPVLLTAQLLKVDPRDDDLRKLLKARYNEAVGELRDYYELKDLASRYGRTMRDSPDDLYGPWQRLVQAGQELCDGPAEKVTLLTQYLEITKEAEALEQARYNAGRVRIGDLHRTRYERLEAEIQLLRVRREADKVKRK